MLGRDKHGIGATFVDLDRHIEGIDRDVDGDVANGYAWKHEQEYYESLPRRPMFVYGTLRTGQGNWRNFLQGRTSQETPAVALDRALYDNGLAYAHERPGHQVVGDLVEVSEADYAEVMQSVDGLEGYDPRHDNGLYLRRTCTVQTDDGREVEAWIYHGNESSTRRFTDDDLVPDGDWLARDRGDGGW